MINQCPYWRASRWSLLFHGTGHLPWLGLKQPCNGGRRVTIDFMFAQSLLPKSYLFLTSVMLLIDIADFRGRIMTTSHLLKRLTSADRA